MGSMGLWWGGFRMWGPSNNNSKPAWVQKISQLSVFQVQKNQKATIESPGNVWTMTGGQLLEAIFFETSAGDGLSWALKISPFFFPRVPFISINPYSPIHILLYPMIIEFATLYQLSDLSPSSWLPSGNLTVRYWTWPSRNSGWIPIENGDVP